MADSRTTAGSSLQKTPPTAAQITDYLNNEAITKTYNSITSRVHEGRVNQSTAISKLKTEFSIPVVLRILLKIQNALTEELKTSTDKDSIQKTKAIVNGAINMFHETKLTLDMGPGDKLAYLHKLKPEEVIIELEELLVTLEDFDVTPGTESLWEEVMLWLDGIHRRTADKVPTGPKPCVLLFSKEIPTVKNLSTIGLKRLQSAYVRCEDKLFYVDRENKVCQEIKLTTEKLLQFDQVLNRQVTDRELKQIKTFTGHDGKKNALFIVLASPSGQDNYDDLKLICGDGAYIRRANQLYYASKSEVVQLNFNAEKFDKYMKTPVCERIYTSDELKRLQTLTGHAHQHSEVALRKADGSFPTIDWTEDYVLYNATNYKMTKMEISLYYHETIRIVARHLQKFQASKKAAEVQASAQAPAKTRPIAMSVAKPAAPVSKPVAQLSSKSTATPVAKPVAMPVVTPNVLPAAKPSSAPVSKPVAMPTVKSAPVPVAQPVAMPNVKPASVPAAKPVAITKVYKEVETVEVSVVMPEPVVNKAEQPVVAVQEPVVAVQEPVAEVQEPVAEVQEPVAETQEPVAETQEPVAEVQEPADALQTSEYIQQFPSFNENDTTVFYQVQVDLRYAEYLRGICDVVNDMLINPLADALSKAIQNPDEYERFLDFQSALKKNGLSPSQNLTLASFKEDAIAAITKYTNQRKKFISYLYKAHSNEALEAINSLKAIEGVQHQLDYVLHFYFKMRSASSKDLLNELAGVLMQAMTRLASPKNHHVAGKTYIESVDNKCMLCIEVPKERAEIVGEIVDTVNEMLENPLLAMLKKDISCYDETQRLQNFQAALTHFNLNFDQKQQIGNFRDDAVSELLLYIQAKDTWRSVFFNKAHAGRAADVISILNNAPDDPRAHLMVMFSLYKEMQGQTSVGLYKSIHSLLLRTLKRLLSESPAAELVGTINDIAANDNNRRSSLFGLSN